jgi:hypothetical protein
MKAFLIALFLPLALQAQVVSTTPAEVRWRVLDEPGMIGLYINGLYAGKLDAYKVEWFYPNHDKQSILDFVIKQNPKLGKKPVEKPKAGICECGDCDCDPCKCGRLKVDNGPKPILFGAEQDLITSRQDNYRMNGRTATRAEALSAIEGANKIPNDGQWIRLTVIGSDVARKRVVEDIAGHPSLSYLKGKVVVADYQPDDILIKDRGFVIGDPNDATVYFQRPNGTVLWRQTKYDGPENLARNLRDKVDGYDPAKDPQPSNPTPTTPTGGGNGTLWLVGIVAFGGSLWYAWSRR